MGSWDTILELGVNSEKYAPLGLDAIPQIENIITSSCANVSPTGMLELRCMCPFHQSDNSQTLRINLNSSHSLGIGFFKCYSCGAKGHFNKLAEKLGADLVLGEVNPEIRNILRPVRVNAYDYFGAPKHNMVDLPANFAWDRGKGIVISGKAFNIVGARLWHTRAAVWQSEEVTTVVVDEHGNKTKKVSHKIIKGADGKPILDHWHPEERIWMPVLDRNEPVAHVAALLGERFWFSKKYLNSKGEWPKRYLWPLEQVMRAMHERRFIVVVEGPADALRLIDNGIPAIANLGVSAWTAAKAEILSAHYNRVFVCMDPDSAGAAAQKAVAESFRGMIPTRCLRLPPKTDPASFTEQQMQSFKRLIQGAIQ